MSAIVSDFEYFKPKTLNEALELISRLPDYVLLSGGTDLICHLKEGFINPKNIVDIKEIAELKNVQLTKDTLTFGSLVTFTEIIENNALVEAFPLLVEASMTVASGAVRNRATMVGNMCSAVPCLDSGAPLMVYEAEVLVKSLKGERTIAIHDWFKGPRKTALEKGEMVVALRMKNQSSKQGAVYVKLGRYTGEDLAQATVAVLQLPNLEYRISFGSVAPVPVRAKKIEALLKGKTLDAKLVEEAKALVTQEISPITDIRATKEYRLHMCQVMMERALYASTKRLEGKGTKLGTALI